MTSTATHSGLPWPLFHTAEAVELAQRWCHRFRLEVCSGAAPDWPDFYLWAGDDHLELRRGPEPHGVWVALPELNRRAAQGGELARACGVTAGGPLEVLDAMAGWGVDGLVLASRGCRVTLVERHPVVSALQEDLLRRSGLVGARCCWGDGFAALTEGPAVDVVYLDPMFPHRSKGALPGKRMQYLALLAEPDRRPLGEWVDVAGAVARRRVVLKRRRRDPAIAKPDWQILGRTVRYDVYRGRARSQPS